MHEMDLVILGICIGRRLDALVSISTCRFHRTLGSFIAHFHFSNSTFDPQGRGKFFKRACQAADYLGGDSFSPLARQHKIANPRLLRAA